MSRRTLSNLLSHEQLSLENVWLWYEFQAALVSEETRRVLDLFAQGTNTVPARYLDKSTDQLEADFQFQMDELDKMTILGMLACTEAALRVDFVIRVSSKRKDDVSRGFREAYQTQGIEKIRLEEDILDVWKAFGSGASLNRAIAELKCLLHLRHWLAHGRYWKPKLGRAKGYQPVEVFDICKALLQAVELMPPDPTT